MWNRTLPNLALSVPIFQKQLEGRFDGKWAVRVGIQKVEEFVSEMFQVTRSDFGLLTTEIDRMAKNTDAMSQSYQGQDLARGIPGLYWINLFSDGLADWLELSTIPMEVATLKRLVGGGWLLKFCESPDQVGISMSFKSSVRQSSGWGLEVLRYPFP